MIKLSALILFVVLSACSTTSDWVSQQDVLPALPSNDFGQRPTIQAISAVHQLSEQERESFLSYYHADKQRRVPGHQRMYNYLLKRTRGLSYENATLTAQGVIDNNHGNCLSLAILTSSYALLAELDIRYELVDSDPIYENIGSVVNKTIHVRPVVYEPEPEHIDNQYAGFLTTRNMLKIDFFPQRRGRFIERISHENYAARYYINLAAEFLAQDDFNQAYWYAREALSTDPHSEDALNLLAVIYKRNDDLEIAAKLYEYAIANTHKQLTLLKNYQILLQEIGDLERLATVQEQLKNLTDPSPFEWIFAARDAELNSNYELAINYYNKALAIAPYLHEAYLGKAQNYRRLGRNHKAERAMEDALEHVTRRDTRDRYMTKLAAIRDS